MLRKYSGAARRASELGLAYNGARQQLQQSCNTVLASKLLCQSLISSPKARSPQQSPVPRDVPVQRAQGVRRAAAPDTERKGVALLFSN